MPYRMHNCIQIVRKFTAEAQYVAPLPGKQLLIRDDGVLIRYHQPIGWDGNFSNFIFPAELPRLVADGVQLDRADELHTLYRLQRCNHIAAQQVTSKRPPLPVRAAG